MKYFKWDISFEIFHAHISTLLAKISGCSLWNLGLSIILGSAESEHPKLTAMKLFWKNSNLCDHIPQYHRQMDRQMAGQTICRSNSVLCIPSCSKNPLKYSTLASQTTAYESTSTKVRKLAQNSRSHWQCQCCCLKSSSVAAAELTPSQASQSFDRTKQWFVTHQLRVPDRKHQQLYIIQLTRISRLYLSKQVGVLF